MRRRAELEERVAKLEAQVEDLASWVALVTADRFGEGLRDGEQAAGESRLVWRDETTHGSWVLVEPVAADENDVG